MSIHEIEKKGEKKKGSVLLIKHSVLIRRKKDY